MFDQQSIYDNCCLLNGVRLNAERVETILERRFRSNNHKTSFDFKSIRPEKPSINAKVSRSFLRFNPGVVTRIRDENELISSSESSSSSEDEIETENEKFSKNDDEYLNELAEWEPDRFLTILSDDDDDESMMDENETSPPNNISEETRRPTEKPRENTDDEIHVTYAFRPVKDEPILVHTDDEDENGFGIPQLDGQIDFLANDCRFKNPRKNNERSLNKVIAKINANQVPQRKTIPIHQIPMKNSAVSQIKQDKSKVQARSNKRRSVAFIEINEQKSSIEPKSRSLGPMKIQNCKTKKFKSPLLSKVSKANEETIRPLNERTACFGSILQVNREKSSKENLSQRRSSQVKSNENAQSSSIDGENRNSSVGRSTSEHMMIAAKKVKQSKSNGDEGIQRKSNLKNTEKNSKSIDALLCEDLAMAKYARSVILDKNKEKKLKRLHVDKKSSHVKSRTNAKPVEHKIVKKKPSRPSNYFDDCIVIDDDPTENNVAPSIVSIESDDEVLEIERQRYSICYNIRVREKLLDHAVRSSGMRVKWLLNLEYLLLEHILICQKKSFVPVKAEATTTNLSTEFDYQIDPSFVSIALINFIKMFILRHSSNDEQEASFSQFALTSHFRYLFIDLPTFKHREKDLHCSQCYEYKLITNILLELLFDLIEFDLCEIQRKTSFRSSLIEDDYFHQFGSVKDVRDFSSFRIKIIVYFIELLALHINRCSRQQQFQFDENENLYFQSLQDFIQQIVRRNSSNIDERLSICFNVIELCLLFSRQKEIRLKQIVGSLLDIVEENPTLMEKILFNKQILIDVRLLLISELINKRLKLKLKTIDDLRMFFRKIDTCFKDLTSNDQFNTTLLRGLFDNFADFIDEMKTISTIDCNDFIELKNFLTGEFQRIYIALIHLSAIDVEHFQKLKRTLILFRLFKCKWNQLSN